MRQPRTARALPLLATLTAALLTSSAAAAEGDPGDTPPAAAATPPPASWTDRVTVSGRVWISYVADLSAGGEGQNAFEIGRMYLGAKARLTDHINVALVLDAPKRVSAVTGATLGADDQIALSTSQGAYDVYVKNAYGEVTDLLTAGLSLRVGMQGLPWIPYEEQLWTYRYQGSALADVEGYWSSTDLGVSLAYDLPSQHLSVVAMVANGETWSSPEVSEHKDFHARVTVRPLAGHGVLGGLSLSGAASFGSYGEGDDTARTRVLGQLAFARPHGALAFAYLITTDPAAKLQRRHPSLASSPGAMADGAGFTSWGWLDLGAFGASLDGLRLMGRVDAWDPDTDLADNGHVREVVGVSYRFNKYVEVLADVQLVQYQDAAGVGGDETQLFIQSDWKF